MNGWNARMYDPQTAGTVAVAYMPLYQEALLKFGGPPATATLDEYARMTALHNIKGLDTMYAAFGIDPVKWSQISTHWMGVITTDEAQRNEWSGILDAEMKRLNELDGKMA